MSPDRTAPSSPRLVIMLLARLVLATCVGLAFWAVAPMILGWMPTTVSSGSMEPAIMTGDVVVTKPAAADELAPGQVPLVTDPDHPDKLRLHRLERVEADGRLVLRGDANPAADSTPVSPDAVRGVGVLRIPLLGLPGLWWRAGNIGALAGCVVTLGVLLLLASERPLSRRLGIGAAASGAAATVLIATTVVPAFRPAYAGFSDTTQASGSFVSAPGMTYRQQVLSDKPLVFWEGESGDATLDTSGNGQTTDYHGITTASPGSHPNSDQSFTVAGDTNYNGPHMTLQPRILNAGPREFSLELWFNNPVAGRGGRMIGFGLYPTNYDTYYDRVVYMTTKGTVIFGVGPYGPHRIETTKRYDDGKWHHLAATRASDGTMQLIIDGEKLSKPTSEVQYYDGFWRVGWGQLDGWPEEPMPRNLPFPGRLDDIAIYDKALPAAHVNSHYEAALGEG